MGIDIILNVYQSRTYTTGLKFGQITMSKAMFYLMTHSTHFIYDYMVKDLW